MDRKPRPRTFTLDDERSQWLDEEAERLGLNRSELLRRWIDERRRKRAS